MRITILTMCPELFGSFLDSHIVRRASSLGVGEIRVIDVRDFAEGSFRAVCDSPFGGGRGLILRAEPVYQALAHVLGRAPEEPREAGTLVAALTPGGTTLTQKLAREYAALNHLILICGHFEGLDERLLDFADALLSVGDYVLTGGELPAMTVADAVLRLLPGCLREGSSEEESFEQGILEYPQYTQPAVWRGKAVPEVLLSGDHGKVDAFRREQAMERTARLRADLLPERGSAVCGVSD